MGLIKECFKFIGVLASIKKEYKEKTARYEKLTTDELKELSEEEIYEAVTMRVMEYIWAREEQEKDRVAVFNSLSNPYKVVYTVDALEREVNNGGLCQFFANSSGATATFVSEALETIGAIEHRQLFDTFIRENGINLSDLSVSDIDDVDDFIAAYDDYPYDDYDNRFYEMESLQPLLTKYIRTYIESF